MGIYRLLWLQLVCLVAVCGCTAAAFVLPVDTVVALAISGALTVALLAGVTRAYAREHCPQAARCAAAPSIRASLGAGVLAGVGSIAAAGLITVCPGAIVLLILLLGACAPTSMRRPALRSLRNAMRAHQCAGPTTQELPIQAHAGESPSELTGQSARESGCAGRGATAQRLPETPLHGLSSLPGPADCAQLTDLQLCWWWRASFVKLQVAASPAQRTVVYESRRALLDALAARDPHSFACWLASGARAASDPARFFTVTHGPPS